MGDPEGKIVGQGMGNYCQFDIYCGLSLANRFFSRSISADAAFVLVLGVAGLVAFLLPYEQRDSSSIKQNVRRPGDGTNVFVNKITPFLIFAVGFGAYSWWIRWLRASGTPGNESSLYQAAVAMLALATIVTVHELGHTIIGLALGMKLRAFIVGPLQWRVRDGNWHFRFILRKIFSVEGGTGVVPMCADFPHWHDVWVSAAGPLFNLLTGVLALWITFTMNTHSLVQLRGAVALFGAWSLVVCAANLLPFRIGDSYSDGATIYQVLSRAAWADFHRAVAVTGSSLVTPLRPRDYDIDGIQRAAYGITSGKAAVLLRVYACSYFLDQERLVEAGQALGEAESIYNQCISELPVEFFSEFVFANAYIRHHAGAARQWWERIEAAKPTHLGFDYWLACSALYWIEGDVREAEAAWAKSNVLAQELPSAGAYDFDRERCRMLREALTRSAPGISK